MRKLPADVTAELRRIGRVLTPETMDAVRGLFARLHEAAGYQAPRIARDLAYGPDPRHRLDVHMPELESAGLPVLLYVHGGGFVGGDKTTPGSPYYDHLGGWAARNGLVAVVMTYRLAPVHQWPAGAEDVAAALSWTREHCVSYGGDPERIVLMGQSAGAAHAASFLAGHAGHGADGLAGAVMLSGIYDPLTAEPSDLVRAYYGDDDHQFTQRSSVPGLAACPVPMLLAVAELDTADFHRQAVTLLDAMLAAHGVIPPFVTIPDHNHQSEIFSLGLDDDAFGSTLARFAHRVTASRSDSSGAPVATTP